MNVGSVVGAAAGLLASLIANLLSVRYGQNHLNRPLLNQARSAAQALLKGKEMDSFFTDYCRLLFVLGQLAYIQCVGFLFFVAPMASLYMLLKQCCDHFASECETPANGWVSSHEFVFMIAFFAGSVGAFFRRWL